MELLTLTTKTFCILGFHVGRSTRRNAGGNRRQTHCDPGQPQRQTFGRGKTFLALITQ